MKAIDPNYISELEYDTSNCKCPNCNVEMIMVIEEGHITCEKCGYTELVVVDSHKPSYKDPPRETTYYGYKRINHFNECLSQFQAKETTDIPDIVYEKINEELKKAKIRDKTKLVQDKLKEILGKLEYNRYLCLGIKNHNTFNIKERISCYG